MRKGKRQRDVEAQRRAEVSRLGNDVKKARKVLEAQQAKLLHAEEAIDIKHAVKKVCLSELGAGLRNCGCATGRMARFDALFRLSRLGAGLSTAQRSDFEWFRRGWDKASVAEFGEQWPECFATWLQGVVDEYLGGGGQPRGFQHFYAQ